MPQKINLRRLTALQSVKFSKIIYYNTYVHLCLLYICIHTHMHIKYSQYLHNGFDFRLRTSWSADSTQPPHALKATFRAVWSSVASHCHYHSASLVSHRNCAIPYDPNTDRYSHVSDARSHNSTARCSHRCPCRIPS